MSLYLIGDLQGCDAPLARLLAEIDFSPSRDTLYFLGDLVNRGPDSAATLRRLAGYGNAARCLLGNHDLHLLAIANGIRAPRPGDTLDELLAAPDCHALLDWLRGQPLARREQGFLMVHAGVLPGWTARQTTALALEVHAALCAPDYPDFLRGMYGSEPARWSDSLTGADRLRVIVNALTRLRFCTPEGTMNFKASGHPNHPPHGCLPWFDVPGRRTAGTPIAFGHWSTLGLLRRPDLVALDTGCVWGGCLSALRLGASPDAHELVQVKCPQAQVPDG